MFSKIFYAALVAGVSAIPQPESPQGYGNAPAGYGQESYNATSVDAAKPSSFTTSSYAEPPAYSAPASSSTPYSPTTPVAPGYGDYSSSSSSTPYDPVSTSSTSVAPGYGDYSSSSSSSTPYSPVSSSKSEYAPPTYGTGKPYSSSSSTEGSPYPPSSKPVYGTGSSSKPVGPTGTGSYPSKSTDELTTITLTNTKTITVTKDLQTYTTTTEEVKTTECPKSEASKLTKTYPASSSTEYSPEKPSSSSEKIPYYPESSKSKPYGPISTGVPSYPSKSVPTGYDTTSEIVYNQTLTYTLGHGSSTTVVTTTVKSTSTLYLTSTVYATKSYATKSESEAKPTGYPDKATKYTTVQSTSTITNTITVYPQPSGKPSGTEGSPNGGASTPVKNTYECKPTTVTVTEKETVYVTLPASKSDVKTEGPKQSSTAVYYPTKSYGSESSGHAKPTGFHTSYTKSAVPSYPVKSDKSSSTEYSPEKPTTSKGTAPVAYPTKSSSTEYSPEKPTAPGYSKPSSSSSTEYSPEKPTTESKPIYSYAPSSSSSTEHAPVSTAYVTPVPSKPAGYESPAGYN